LISGRGEHIGANQQKLSVIGNNLANLNTVGFKASNVNFADLVSQSVGGPSANPMQIGLGVAVGQIRPSFTQGSIDKTGVATDVAIQGSGFFVVGEGVNRTYTRAGDFNFNADGMPEGEYAVTVVWHPRVIDGEDYLPGPNVLPLAYARPETTPCRVRVSPKSNELPPLRISL